MRLLDVSRRFLKKNTLKNGILLSSLDHDRCSPTRPWAWCLLAYFWKSFDTNHEAITQEIIQSPETEIHSSPATSSARLPRKVASVIDHTYPNKQVVQLISSQIDADRMDHLLRDSYFTGASYGEFDLTRILRVIRPVENGIAFQRNGMHAIEDYVLSRATRCICRFISTQQHAPWKFSTESPQTR